MLDEEIEEADEELVEMLPDVDNMTDEDLAALAEYEDPFDGEDYIDASFISRGRTDEVDVVRALLDTDISNLDILVDWYLMDSTPSSLESITDIDYEDIIEIFEGLGGYQHTRYMEDYPDDPNIVEFEINITPITLVEYLNSLNNAEELDEVLLDELMNQQGPTPRTPRTVSKIIMKGW